MRAVAVVIGLLVVAAAPARAERPCPAGSERRGAPPPEGHAVWCVGADGIHHGPYTMWFLDGTLMREGFLNHGNMQGQFHAWHRNGKLAEESFWRDGVRVGVWRAWRADGTPIYEIGYRNGKQHGYEKRYHPNGRIASSTRWRWGKRHGTHIERDDQGALVVRGSYTHDLRHGSWKHYAIDGHTLVETYAAGTLTAATWNDRPVVELCEGIADHISDSEHDPGPIGLHETCVRLAAKQPMAVLCLHRATTWDQVYGCYGVDADTTD